VGESQEKFCYYTNTPRWELELRISNYV
jgi:hypothetical protein